MGRLVYPYRVTEVSAMTFEFDLFATLLLPILIMLAKIVEVTMGTLRIMFISKGIKVAAVFVGFFLKF